MPTEICYFICDKAGLGINVVVVSSVRICDNIHYVAEVIKVEVTVSRLDDVSCAPSHIAVCFGNFVIGMTLKSLAAEVLWRHTCESIHMR